MTGYVRKRRIIDLDFSTRGEDFAGLEVKARSISMGELLRVSELLELKVFGLIKVENVPKARELLELLAGALVEWNVTEEDGTPVPRTVEGLLSLDDDFNHDLIGSWLLALSAVPPPLDKPSPDGDPSLEQNIPMEVS